MRILQVLIFLSFAFSINGQVANDRWAIEANIFLPTGQTNKAYRDYLNGLTNVVGKIQFKPLKSFFISVAPRFAYYSAAEYKTPLKVGGGMKMFGAGIEFGYNQWFTKNLGMDICLQGGSMLHSVNIYQFTYKENSTDKDKIPFYKNQFNSLFIQPSFSFLVRSDEAVVYKWIVSYNFENWKMNPSTLGFQTQGGYSESDLKRNASSLFIGFGISYYFGNPRADTDILINEEPK